MAKSTSKLFQSEEPKEMKEDAMNFPEETTSLSLNTSVKKSTDEVAESTSNNTEDDIQDINLSAIKKKRFRINGDSKKILELNTSDLGISARLSSAYERLNKHMEEVGATLSELPEDGDEITDEKEELIQNKLQEIDEKMKKEMDFIFDAPVSEICCDGGSMYDPFNGMFRFEHIIDALSKLYETNLNSEFANLRRRINTKTSKYTKKYHN